MSITSTKYKADGISFDFFLSNGEIGGTGPGKAGYESIVKRAQGDGHWPPSAYDPYKGRSLATAKAEKKQGLKVQGRSLGTIHIDPHIVKSLDPQDSTSVPVDVRQYKNSLIANFGIAKTDIDALTTKQEVYDYQMNWPTPPV